MGSRGLSSKGLGGSSKSSKSDGNWSERQKAFQNLSEVKAAEKIYVLIQSDRLIDRQDDEERNNIDRQAVELAGLSWDDLRTNQSLMDEGLNTTGLQRLTDYLDMHEQGVVLPDADFDKQAKSAALNGVLLHRGATQAAIDNLMYGDKMYIGDGIHGNGIYLSTYAGTAMSYGEVRTTAYIDKGLAKVITENKLRDMFYALPQDVRRYFGRDTDDAISMFAIYKGYNVIHVPGGNGYRSHSRGGEDYYVPLTRKVLVFREHFKHSKFM